MIRNIIFDFGGVLIDWNPRHLMRKVFDTEEEVDFFLSNVCTQTWNERQDGGRPFAEGLAEATARYPQYAVQIRIYFERWGEMLGGLNDVNVNLLRKSKAAGFRIFGLTNWSRETIHYALDAFDFLDLFDDIVVSGRENLLKPQPEIYQLLLDRNGLKPAECCFIDDNQANLDGASALGIIVPDVNTVMDGTWVRNLHLRI